MTRLGVGDHTPEPAPSGVRRTTAAEIAAIGLPPAKSVPLLVMRRVHELPLDPQAAFVLDQVDGRTTIQDILDLGAMSRSKTLDAIVHLVALGVIAFA